MFMQNIDFGVIDLATPRDVVKLPIGKETVLYVQVQLTEGCTSWGAGVLTVGRRLEGGFQFAGYLGTSVRTEAPFTISADGLYGPYDVMGVAEAGVYVSTVRASSGRVRVVLLAKGAIS